MKICINCGWSNLDESFCCEKCGQSLRFVSTEPYSSDVRIEDDFTKRTLYPKYENTKADNDLLCDRYQISNVLFSNSVNSIVIGKDLLTDEDVCLRIFEGNRTRCKDTSLDEYKFLTKFKEFRVLSPNYYGINPEGMPFYVVPSVNRLLSEYLGEIGFDFIERFLREITLTLRGLKDKNISCGNLTPHTIALDKEGHFYLLPEAFSEICKHAITRTEDNICDSENSYMAPEFFSENTSEYPTAEGDIWAVGAIAYELITGSKPFGPLGGATQRHNDNYNERLNFHSTEVVDYKRLVRLQYIVRRVLDIDKTRRPSFDFVLDSMSISVLKSQQLKGQFNIVHPIRRILTRIECEEISIFTAQSIPGPGPLTPLIHHFIGAFYMKKETCGYLRLQEDGLIQNFHEMSIKEYNELCRFT